MGQANVSTNSLVSTSADDDDDSTNNTNHALSGSGGLRASVDAAMDKVKERTKRSGEERRGSQDSTGKRRLSSLIPRRKRSSVPDLPRNSSAQSGDLGEGVFSVGNRSVTSLLAGSGRSSLLTDDNSDAEG